MKNPAMKHLGQINVSVANMYRAPEYQSEVVSQALMGEIGTVIKKNKNFTLMKLQDGYQGWISNYQWVDQNQTNLEKGCVRSHFLRIYQEPDLTAEPLRDAVIGSHLSIKDHNDGWVKITLPDGQEGWAEERAFEPFPKPGRDSVRQFAMEFLGYPYFWGGCSAKGFDCSGLIYTVYNLLGIRVSRDSWMQHRDAKFVGTDPLVAEVADLYFFSEDGHRITHVGIAIGEGKILHARGWVRIDSMKKSDAEYVAELTDTFVDVRTFFD